MSPFKLLMIGILFISFASFVSAVPVKATNSVLLSDKDFILVMDNSPEFIKKEYCNFICKNNPSYGGKYCNCDSVILNQFWNIFSPFNTNLFVYLNRLHLIRLKSLIRDLQRMSTEHYTQIPLHCFHLQRNCII